MTIAMDIIDRTKNPTDWQVHEEACCASIDHGSAGTYVWHEFRDGSAMLFRDTVKPVGAFDSVPDALQWAENGHMAHGLERKVLARVRCQIRNGVDWSRVTVGHAEIADTYLACHSQHCEALGNEAWQRITAEAHTTARQCLDDERIASITPWTE